MRTTLTFLLLSAFGSIAAAAESSSGSANTATASPPEIARPALTLRVMSFNVRVPTRQPGPPDAWPYRRPVLKNLLARETPDIIGTQEGVYPQLRDIAADLPDYEWIGLGREGGSKGEFCAIFYRRDRFEPVAFDHFWLSDTPNLVASITWGTAYHRMVSWVRFRERATGREFYFWNTHFDHQVETARQKSAQLIRERLAPLDPTVPLILVGDFNCAAGASRAYEILTQDAGLADTWTLAAHRTNERLNTFHNYQPPLTEGQRIDWILARPPVDVSAAEILDHQENGQPPSDHFPVTATLVFP